MTKNPFINALSASGYIVLVVLAIFNLVDGDGPDNILIPITMLSLFVLSASVMGFLFLYRPGELYLEGKKKEAVSFFLRTVGSFGAITAVLLTILFIAGPQG